MGDKDSAEIFDELDEAFDSEQSDNEVDDDKEKTSKKHKRLLKDISTITGVPAKRAALRSEPSTQIDEHLWTQKRDGDKKVQLADLLQSVPKTASLGSLKKKIEKFEKSQAVLDEPLSKPQKEKIERTIAYKENAKDISKWAPTVIKNREAERLSFPLNQYKPQEITTKSVAVSFKPRTSLEKEIAAVLKGSSGVLERRNKELTEDEEKALQAVDLEQALARRKELQKLRALQSYYELKCKRQKKIKSKKFRKILRKSEQRKEAKKSANLTKDEEEELLDETEKKRVLERAHLRHRNTSKWAKKLIIKSNRSKEETQLLHDQLRASRQLTEQKVYDPDSEDDEQINAEVGDEISLLKATSDNADNPWLLGKDSDSTKGKNTVKATEDKDESKSSSDSEEDEEDEEKEDTKSDDEWNAAGKNLAKSGSKESRMPKKGKKRTTDSETKENSDLDSDVEYEHVIDVAYAQENAERVSHGNQPMAEAYDTHDTTLTDKSKRVSGKNGKLNPDDFLSVESKALDVDVIITDNSDLDFSRSKNQKSLIREAFANDAVLEDFAEEKKARNEKRMPNDVDLTLPGWGEWAGADMDTEKILSRKRKKFVKKAKKPRPSKDAHLKHVIINEETNTRFTSNQVSSLPFPFKSTAQFERSVRQPLGKAWNTPSMNAKLTQPRISTLIGTIIEPIKKTKEVTKAAEEKTQKSEKFISTKGKMRKRKTS